MMRQVALGAVVAFVLTVIALSVFQPKADETPPPAVVVNPTRTPAADQATVAPAVRTVAPVRPLMLRPSNAIRPEMLQQRQLQAIEAPAVDAGTP